MSDREPLRTLPKVIEAAHFNRVRLALRRVANPLRLSLPEHRGLDAIIDDQTWLVVDAVNGDLPVLAWSEFEAQGRSALHEPVRCQLQLYHAQAGLIMGTALDALARAVDERLAAEKP